MLAQTLGWPIPAEGDFIPDVPEILRDFLARAMPNRLIAAHVLVGCAIRAVLYDSAAFNKGPGDRASLAQTCFDWIDRVCTDDAIVNIHVATGHIWRLDLLTPEGVEVGEYWPEN